jgi:hypothetical protein
MKKSLTFLLMLCSCVGTSIEPGTQNSCSMTLDNFFVSNNAWFWTTSSLFSITNPSNPLAHYDQGSQYQHGADTAFTNGQRLYLVNNGSVTIDSFEKNSYYPQYMPLTSYPRHIATYPGYLYLIRHVTNIGNNYCWHAADSINAIEVDNFADTLYAATLSTRIALTDPQDIAINASTLYVLDVVEGLKIYSLTDPAHPSLITTIASITGYHMDLTPQQTLIVHSAAGLTQYDVSNAASPVLLGKIQ